MNWIDTHAHVYLPAFEEDQNEWIERAKAQGIQKIFLPNIDLESIPRMLTLEAREPSFFIPMMGLHPCDVKDDYEQVLAEMEAWWDKRDFAAVGEIGIDLYWDKTTLPIQQKAFIRQIEWALKKDKPIVIHARESFKEIFEILDEFKDSGLMGIFHCFTGSIQDAQKIMNYKTFMMGIGGVVTYDRAKIMKVLVDIPTEFLVMETDSPFLPPVPHRGQRNESSYIPIIAQKIAEAKNMRIEDVAAITTANANKIFQQKEMA
jgi:TatD DNase family protein